LIIRLDLDFLRIVLEAVLYIFFFNGNMLPLAKMLSKRVEAESISSTSKQISFGKGCPCML